MKLVRIGDGMDMSESDTTATVSSAVLRVTKAKATGGKKGAAKAFLGGHHFKQLRQDGPNSCSGIPQGGNIFLLEKDDLANPNYQFSRRRGESGPIPIASVKQQRTASGPRENEFTIYAVGGGYEWVFECHQYVEGEELEEPKQGDSPPPTPASESLEAVPAPIPIVPASPKPRTDASVYRFGDAESTSARVLAGMHHLETCIADFSPKDLERADAILELVFARFEGYQAKRAQQRADAGQRQLLV